MSDPKKLRPPTPEEVERILRLWKEPTWSPEDMAWADKVSREIVWDVSLGLPEVPQ